MVTLWSFLNICKIYYLEVESNCVCALLPLQQDLLLKVSNLQEMVKEIIKI